MTVEGWSFDLEILVMAQELNLTLVEIPVFWKHDPRSKYNLLKDALNAARALYHVRERKLSGFYKEFA